MIKDAKFVTSAPSLLKIFLVLLNHTAIRVPRSLGPYRALCQTSLHQLQAGMKAWLTFCRAPCSWNDLRVLQFSYTGFWGSQMGLELRLPAHLCGSRYASWPPEHEWARVSCRVMHLYNRPSTSFLLPSSSLALEMLVP